MDGLLWNLGVAEGRVPSAWGWLGWDVPAAGWGWDVPVRTEPDVEGLGCPHVSGALALSTSGWPGAGGVPPVLLGSLASFSELLTSEPR